MPTSRSSSIMIAERTPGGGRRNRRAFFSGSPQNRRTWSVRSQCSMRCMSSRLAVRNVTVTIITLSNAHKEMPIPRGKVRIERDTELSEQVRLCGFSGEC
jgi:hypothetical protein